MRLAMQGVVHRAENHSVAVDRPARDCGCCSDLQAFSVGVQGRYEERERESRVVCGTIEELVG
jgi:hypothetical protein